MEPKTPPKDDPDKLKFSEGQAFFKSVTGLKSESEVVDYQEGGVNNFTRKVVGQMKWPILLIVLGALAMFAGGLVFLGSLLDQDSGGDPTSTSTPAGDPR